MRVLNIFNLPSFFSARKSAGGILTALLLSLILAGCGGNGGGGSFVSTPDTGGAGGGVPAAQTGSVTYHFVQAQSAPIVVPTGTQRLRFEFFTGPNGDGNLILRESRDYADTIKIDGVPVSSRSTVVTAFGSDGFPVAQFKASVALVAQGNIDVFSTSGVTELVTLDSITVAPLSLSLGQGDSVRLDVFGLFSSGDRVQLNATHLGEASFSSGDLSIANVVDNTVSAVGTGTTTVTVGFRLQSTAVPVSVNLGPVQPPIATALNVDQATLALPPGTQSSPLVFTASFTGEPDRVVTLADGVVLSPLPPAGFSVGPDQRIRVAPTVAPGTSAVLRFTYLGRSVNVVVSVTNAVIQGLEVTPEDVSIPFGGFERALVVKGRYSNGSTFDLIPGGVPPEPTLTFIETSPLFSVSVASGAPVVVSEPTGTSGTSSLTVRYTTGSQTFEADVDVSVGVRHVSQLQVVPASIGLTPGEAEEVVVNALLDDGSIVDVSDFDALQSASTSGGSAVLANKNNIVGVSPVTDAIVTFTLPNSGAAIGGVPSAATGTLAVTVTAITLTSVEYFYAGNPLAQSVSTVNLPRGYVGIFEVEGTFSNGAKRRLRASEYKIAKNGGALNPAAIQLFQSPNADYPAGYSLRQPDSRFTDGAPRAVDPTVFPGNPTGTVYQVVDDILFFNDVNGPRLVVNNAVSSNANQVTVKDTFRGVAADWYRAGFGRYAPTKSAPDYNVGGGLVAPSSSANIVITIPGYSQFDRTLTVTITDPLGPPTIESVAFANYPGDPNIARNTPRELEVRVNFPAANVPLSLPPFVSAQNNFKLAEANVAFATDDLTDTTDQLPDYTDLIHHRATELGFIGVTANVPVNVGLILVAAQPIAGTVIAPVIEVQPVFVIDTAENEHPGTPTDPESYTPGVYGHDLAAFGQSSALTISEPGGDINPGFDPGPTLVAGNPAGREVRAPNEGVLRTYISFDNETKGFRVVDPLSFTLSPSASPFSIAVGSSEYFRVLVQWAATEPVVDVSRDYTPVIVNALTELDVVGFPIAETGNLVVSGVNQSGDGAVIQALDVAGALISPAGSNSTNETTVQVVAP